MINLYRCLVWEEVEEDVLDEIMIVLLVKVDNELIAILLDPIGVFEEVEIYPTNDVYLDEKWALAMEGVMFQANDDEEKEFHSSDIKTNGGTLDDYMEYDDWPITNVHFYFNKYFFI